MIKSDYTDMFVPKSRATIRVFTMSLLRLVLHT